MSYTVCYPGMFNTEVGRIAFQVAACGSPGRTWELGGEPYPALQDYPSLAEWMEAVDKWMMGG